jgi:23S rRNA (pseudouridine1915-N3)-methyltransferase
MFRIEILAIGRLKRGPFSDLAAFYHARLRTPVRITELEARKGGADAVRTLEEGRLLLQALPPDALVVALDERGRNLTSLDFFGLLQQARAEARPLVCIIGGADGLAADVRARAEHLMAFGQSTWPHQLVRVMLLEQIYRAETILAGHPYHREG